MLWGKNGFWHQNYGENIYAYWFLSFCFFKIQNAIIKYRIPIYRADPLFACLLSDPLFTFLVLSFVWEALTFLTVFSVFSDFLIILANRRHGDKIGREVKVEIQGPSSLVSPFLTPLFDDSSFLSSDTHSFIWFHLLHCIYLFLLKRLTFLLQISYLFFGLSLRFRSSILSPLKLSSGPLDGITLFLLWPCSLIQLPSLDLILFYFFICNYLFYTCLFHRLWDFQSQGPWVIYVGMPGTKAMSWTKTMPYKQYL